MRFTSSRIHLMAIVLILVGVAIADAGPSGAIFTTDKYGTFVNGNVYDYADDVYLNGGPRPNALCTAAGLPDDEYYFQVTDPSGAMVLSLPDDLEDRRFRVAGGIIVEYLGTRFTGTGKCGSVTVQLFPFTATPNPGGEYKVWITPVGALVDGQFVHSQSKTDNFKVVPPDPGPGD